MSSVLTPSQPQARPLPESEQLYEVVDGVRVEKPVSAASVWVANELTMLLGSFARAEKLGTVVMEMIFILDHERDLRRRPDVAFVSAEKWPVGKMPPLDSDWEIIPDLAIEVISPGNRYTDVRRKLHEYFEYGVQEVWLIVPEERLVQVYHSVDDTTNVRGNQELTTELIPGWSVAISTLVPEIPQTSPAE